MTKNWPTFLQDNSRLPETIDEAVDRLMVILDDEQKAVLAAMPEDDLINLHFSLGIAIRNAFWLHNPDSKLLAACGVVHADDAAGMIIQVLWRRLRASSVA